MVGTCIMCYPSTNLCLFNNFTLYLIYFNLDILYYFLLNILQNSYRIILKYISRSLFAIRDIPLQLSRSSMTKSYVLAAKLHKYTANIEHRCMSLIYNIYFKLIFIFINKYGRTKLKNPRIRRTTTDISKIIKNKNF